MELNDAYESLETMRRLNLELQCLESEVPRPIDHTQCTMCLLEQPKRGSEKSSPSLSSSRLFSLRRKCASDQCLTCAAPSCPKHGSVAFRKQGITLCQNCEQVFSIDFLLDCLTSAERRTKLFWLMDLYDRSVLMLKFADREWIDNVADALEESQARRNRFNMGGSSAGIVSGVLGVAAAFTIWTPAGPPLLIASLMLGGGATAVQTGADVRHEYFLEPSKVANRILALHGMVLSILTVTGTLRDAALLDHEINYPPGDGGTDSINYINDDVREVVEALRVNHVQDREALLAEATQHNKDSSRTALLIDRTARAAEAAERQQEAAAAAAALEASSPSETGGARKSSTIVGRNTRYVSRVGAGVMRTARFAPLVGGALAAASLLVEASSISSTLKSIQAGSPSEKGHALRRIQLLMPNLPSTNQLEQECKAYLNYMETVHDDTTNPLSHQEATYLIAEVSALEQEVEEGDDNGDGGDNGDKRSRISSSDTGNTASTSKSGSDATTSVEQEPGTSDDGADETQEEHPKTPALPNGSYTAFPDPETGASRDEVEESTSDDVDERRQHTPAFPRVVEMTDVSIDD